jgi:hyperosmotically inducible protein
MLKRLAVLLFAAGTIVTLACAQSDPGITTAVKSKLAVDDTVKAYQIDVDTTEGVVTLRGTVDRAAAKEQAVAIARRTDGVRNVVDQITVSSQAAATTGDLTDTAKEAARDARDKAGDAASKTGAVLTDAAVTTAVKSKFLADTAISGLKIDVDTTDGVVTLKGTVASKAEADRAVSVARNTDGVKRVINNLRVQG